MLTYLIVSLISGITMGGMFDYAVNVKFDGVTVLFLLIGFVIFMISTCKLLKELE